MPSWNHHFHPNPGHNRIIDTVEQGCRLKAENKTEAWPTVFHDFIGQIVEV